MVMSAIPAMVCARRLTSLMVPSRRTDDHLHKSGNDATLGLVLRLHTKDLHLQLSLILDLQTHLPLQALLSNMNFGARLANSLSLSAKGLPHKDADLQKPHGQAYILMQLYL